MDRRVRFVAFANEEPPFFEEKDAMGSYVYAQECRARGENIVAMISLDALGVYSRHDHNLKRSWPVSWVLQLLGLTSATDYVAFMSNWDANSGTTAAQCAELFSQHSAVEVRTVSLPFIASFGKEIFAWSDDWSFTRESYPAFTVTDTAFYRSDRYHEWSDSVTNLTAHDYKVFSQVVIGLEGMIKTLSMAGTPAPKTKWYAGLGWMLIGVSLALIFLFHISARMGRPKRT